MDNLLTLEEYKNYLKNKRDDLRIEIKALDENVSELDYQVSIINSTLCVIEGMEKKYYYEERQN